MSKGLKQISKGNRPLNTDVLQLNASRNETGISDACDLLKSKFGERLSLNKSIRDQHCHTATWLAGQRPDAVFFPRSAAEVSELVSICSEHRVPIVPFGAGTSLEGHVNAPRGGISVDFSQMNGIRAVNGDDFDCVVEPGLTRKELNSELRATGLFFPIDPGANASIGGMASTRASGTNSVRYGTMKDNVLALEVVTADGSIIRTGSRARKSSAGYDLTSLFIGAEGTLGIITELTLRLRGIPEAISAATCCFADVDGACRAVIESIQFGVPMARIELLDELTVRAVNSYSSLSFPESPLLLLEFHGSEGGVNEQAETVGEICAEHGGSRFDWTAKPEERTRLWQARHDAYWAALSLRPGTKGLSTDACVPLSKLADCVATAKNKAKELGFIAPVVGHVGDGNFHVLLLVDTENSREIELADEYINWLAELAIRIDGTCTGEHGIGQGKIGLLEQELRESTDCMSKIKRALDPLNIMNPGKILRV